MRPLTQTVALIQGLGIDAELVARDNVTEEGYWLFSRDAQTGMRVVDPDNREELLKTWQEWPEGTGKLVYATYVSENGGVD